jgi:hypothetical protein
MSDAATLADRPTDHQLQLLGELAEIGLDIARAIDRRVQAAEPEPSLADLNAAATAYARVARAVRQTIMLQSRLLADRKAETARAGDLRARVRRIVRQAIEDEHDDKEQVERLAQEAAEGLEQERFGDVLIRPIGEIVAGICKDLGLDPDWPAFAGEISAAEAFARGAAEPASAPLTGPIEVRWLDDDDDENSGPVPDSS